MSDGFSVAITSNPADRKTFEEIRKDAFPAEQQIGLDPLDEFCDYLLVKQGENLAAGCRMLGSVQAKKAGGFYTASEFNIQGFLESEANPMELSRFCIADEYRQNARILRRFWRFMASYVSENNITALFGCASFPGVEPSDLSQEFHQLKKEHLMPKGLIKPKPQTEHFHLKELPTPSNAEEPKFPPLVKSYINMGGKVSDVGFIDRQFNCIDLCIAVKINTLPQKYSQI